jgi:hypothetical protein
MDCIGHVTLLADTMISSLLKPPDVVWLRVWCCRQPQLFGDLNWDEVLLDIVINNEMQQGPFHPHLSMEEVLPLFRIYWFFWLNCCGRESSSGTYVDDLSFFIILWIRFRIRVHLFVFDLDHQWLFRAKFISVVPLEVSCYQNLFMYVFSYPNQLHVFVR